MLLERLLSQELATQSLSHFLVAGFVAYIGGILASLTPCVYPMIPITVGVLGNAFTTRTSVFRAGCIYSAGMATTYTILGVTAALTGRIFGSITHTHSWYMAIGIIMTIAALLMLEVLHFNPLAILSRFGISLPHTEATSSVALFGLGASSGLVAAPCTTPLLTTIITYIAHTRSILLGGYLMLLFSLGLASMLLGLSAGLMRRLPRSGRWMHRIKTSSGILLLLFAEYIFYCAGQMLPGAF